MASFVTRMSGSAKASILLSFRCGTAGLPAFMKRVVASANFIAVAAKHLDVSDAWCILYPYFRPLLKADVSEMDSSFLLDVVSEPVSQSASISETADLDGTLRHSIEQLSNSILEAARQWYIANPKGSFWSSISVPGKSSQKSRAFHMVPQAEWNLPPANNDMYATPVSHVS